MKKIDNKHEDDILQKRIEELEKEVASSKDEISDWKAKCMRAIADYQNLERRSQEQKELIRKFASEIVLERLFPALDTLKKATDHLKDAGLDLAYKELVSVITEQGVEEIKTVGEEFNPHEMECIEVVAGEDNKVIEELRPGYKLYEKVLRVAQVKVGKKV